MKRSKHSLSHYKLATFSMGELVPVSLVEVLPGDTIQQATSAFIRVSPLVTPVMHPVKARIHHWFVPHRLVWDDFEKFITGGPDGADASVLPKITINPAEGSLADYLGLPPGTSIDVNALPFRAYAMIWNEYYRDQDLQTMLGIATSSGADATTNTALQFVTWEKDYFTTARPWTQKGPAVTMNITGADRDIKVNKSDGTDIRALFANASSGNVNVGPGNDTLQNWSATNKDLRWNDPALTLTVQNFRESIALQRFAEARARFGSRYTEYLRSLGIRSQDARLDRPEYLGGGRQSVQFSEVLQTGTNFDANTGVGNMKGHGMGAMRSNRYRRFFGEHGYIISLMSVMPKSIYAQGVAKHWTRTTNEEFFQKELEDIGQDEIYNREIYSAHSSPTGVFGYQDRYDEYRRMESGIAGEFRTSLSNWHMARIFSADPACNASFVAANPTNRIYASTSTDQLLVMINNSIQARRMVRGR